MKLVRVIFCTFSIVLLLQIQNAAAAQEPVNWVARLVALEGNAHLKKAGVTKWGPVKVDDRFFAGDMLRVMDNSRAAVVMRNQSNVRLDENTTITFKGIEEGRTVFVEILEGMSHFFNRVTRSLKVFTPYVNGTV